MVNPEHIYAFCNAMKVQYGAGFVEKPYAGSVKLLGEYYTQAGTVLSISLTVYSNKVEIRIYNHHKRLIFTDNCTININMNTRLIQFIQKSVLTY